MRTDEDSKLNELLGSHWCVYNSYNSPRQNDERKFVGIGIQVVFALLFIVFAIRYHINFLYLL